MSEEPRKPVWFPPPRPLPDPRNLPQAPAVRPATPAQPPDRAPDQPRPGGVVWRLPWPPSAMEAYTPADARLTAIGRRYLSAVEQCTASRRREFSGPLWLSVMLVPPAGLGRRVQAAHRCIEPVLEALAYIGAWHDIGQVRVQRYVLAEPADDACAWATVAPL